jgi:hypothetical protein
MKKIVAFVFIITQVMLGWASTPKISVLTCTPGHQLYSVFGHSAIRVQDTINDRPVDLVFNYGTFQFTDKFYGQFAQGRLDYYLSVAPFYEFQQQYLFDGRGIREQYLLMSDQDLKKLEALLLENAEESNCTFRYHFFKDNCSVRVWNIIKKASSQNITIDRPAPTVTFRQAIQTYLDYMPWGDWGIDLALGAPCDETMTMDDLAFLPDSLENLLANARYGNHHLVTPSLEMIPVDQDLILPKWNQPLWLNVLLLIAVLIVGTWMSKKGALRNWVESIFMFLMGALGLLIIFLWFFTDHDTTHANWNLLWANPIWFYLMFFPPRQCAGFQRKVAILQLILTMLAFLGFGILPQSFHPAVIPLLLMQLYFLLKILKPFWFTQHLNEKA